MNQRLCQSKKAELQSLYVFGKFAFADFVSSDIIAVISLLALEYIMGFTITDHCD